MIGLFDAETDMNDVVAILENHPLLGAGFAHKIEQLEDKDWEREWMDNFHPMRFGERLWICPSWRDVPDENAVNVMLDPGLAFGTGTHPTTSLCLQWLDSLDLTGKTVIDFGCGSGILAIAALKLGAAKAIGIDIDPQAIQASRDNAERNGVSDRLELYLPKDQPEEMKADVVVANILAGPLRELAPLISVLPVSGGLLGLSVFWQARQRAFAKLMPTASLWTRSWKKKSGAALPVVRINLRIAVWRRRAKCERCHKRHVNLPIIYANLRAKIFIHKEKLRTYSNFFECKF